MLKMKNANLMVLNKQYITKHNWFLDRNCLSLVPNQKQLKRLNGRVVSIVSKKLDRHMWLKTMTIMKFYLKNLQ